MPHMKTIFSGTENKCKKVIECDFCCCCILLTWCLTSTVSYKTKDYFPPWFTEALKNNLNYSDKCFWNYKNSNMIKDTNVQ